MNILALCTGNSARPILLEGVLNAAGHATCSAGSRPVGRISLTALDTLAHHGILPDDLRPKSWDEFAAPDAPDFDLVITVCASAAGKTCPIRPGGLMQIGKIT